MQYFCKSVVGSSHIETQLPCQDSTLCEKFDKGCIMAVSDGHGSRTYVRSHIGSNLACSIAVNLTRQFVLDNYEFLSKIGQRSYTPDNGVKADTLFLNLFTSIHDQWYESIKDNVANTPFTNEEKVKLGNADIKEAFGCTLIVAVKTDRFTFAFHIGDGRIYTISYKNEWKQPVPWDSNCEDNITTSLCESNPVGSFRYYIDSSEVQPYAIFACSDGIEDCYGGSHDGNFQSEKLEVDYSEVIRAYLQDEKSDFDVDCESFLKDQSKRFSHDDMSIAFVLDDRYQLQEVWLKIIECQRLKFETAEAYRTCEIRLLQLSDRLKTIGSNVNNYKLELDRAKKDLNIKQNNRGMKEKEKLSEKSCKELATTFNAKIIQFQQDVKDYCDSFETDSKDITPEVLNFSKKLTGYVLKAVNKALELIRTDITTKQNNAIRLQSEIDKLDVEINKLSNKIEKQEECLRAEQEKYDNIKSQNKSLIEEKDKCERKKVKVEEKADSDIRILHNEIKNKVPYDEVVNYSYADENGEVYNTLNISKRSSGEKDEDVNFVIQSANLIEVSYSENHFSCNISMDDFNQLIERVKRMDSSIFSSDGKIFNDSITIMFYKKDGSCITKTISNEREEACEIWNVCTRIAHQQED